MFTGMAEQSLDLQRALAGNETKKVVCIRSAINAGMTARVVFHLSMSVGHSFARGENGNAVSGVEKKRRVA